MTKWTLSAAILAALATAAMPALAEQADRSKPVSITANNFDGDEIKQVAIYSPQGFRIFTMTGGPVRMKERRDPKTKGVEEWMHAVGTKAVYDEAADKITLTGNAKISRSENGTVKDTTVGDIIIYDMLRARSYVKGDTVGGHKTRVNTVLAPRQQTAGKGQNTKSSPAPLQGVSRINSGKRSK